MTVERAPISGPRLSREISGAAGDAAGGVTATGWSPRIVAETGSTNADVAAAARAGAAEGLVVIAESQTAGRGRLGRVWQSPPRAGLMLSVLLRPEVEPARWGWLPLLAGVALADTVRQIAKLDAGLKWPNDLLIGGRKCAGVLAEVALPGAVVVGIGLNVTQQADELPTSPTGLPATSLLLEGAATVDRTWLATELLLRLRDRYQQWQAAGGDPDRSGLLTAYLSRCTTVGRQVAVLLPGETELVGQASSVDGEGRLVVLSGGQTHRVAAGDVVHLR